MWRPPDGHELLYFDWDSGDLELYGVRPDNTGRHLVDDLGVSQQLEFAPMLGGDGGFLVYAADAEDSWYHNFVLDLGTGHDRELSLGPADHHELHGVLSPDGTKLLFHDIDASASTVQEMLAPVDGSARAIPIGPPVPIVNGSADLDQEFSPDGRTILISEGQDNAVRIVDTAAGGIGRDAGWSTGDLPGWQRTAP